MMTYNTGKLDNLSENNKIILSNDPNWPMVLLPHQITTITYLIILVDLSLNMIENDGLNKIKKQLIDSSETLFQNTFNVNLTI